MPALAGRTPPQKLNTTCFPPKISTDVVFGAAPLGTRDRHVRVGSAGHRFHHPDFHRRQRVGPSNSRSPGCAFSIHGAAAAHASFAFLLSLSVEHRGHTEGAPGR